MCHKKKKIISSKLAKLRKNECVSENSTDFIETYNTAFFKVSEAHLKVETPDISYDPIYQNPLIYQTMNTVWSTTEHCPIIFFNRTNIN